MIQSGDVARENNCREIETQYVVDRVAGSNRSSSKLLKICYKYTTIEILKFTWLRVIKEIKIEFLKKCPISLKSLIVRHPICTRTQKTYIICIHTHVHTNIYIGTGMAVWFCSLLSRCRIPGSVVRCNPLDKCFLLLVRGSTIQPILC